MAASLTPRESQMVKLLHTGMENREIATELGLSLGTIRNLQHRLALKLQITDWGSTRVRMFRVTYKPTGVVEDLVHLSPRQTEIAKLVYEGYQDKEIQKRLGIFNVQQVKNYLREIYDRVGVWNRTELALHVANRGGDQWRTYTAQVLDRPYR